MPLQHSMKGKESILHFTGGYSNIITFEQQIMPDKHFMSWETELGNARSIRPCLQMKKKAREAVLPARGHLELQRLPFHMSGAGTGVLRLQEKD